MNLLSEHNRILRVGEGGTEVYLPGDNINITDHVISGKYWDNEINSAISSTSGYIVNEAFNQSTAWNEGQGYLTAHQDVSNLPYVQNSALGYNGNLVSSISGKGLFAESANNSYHADSATSAGFVESANFANSALNSKSANFANSAWRAVFVDGGWEHDSSGNITAYNNSAFVGSNGGKYQGILPIVVNNEEMKISAKSASLGVQEPLYFVEDSESATVIGIESGAFPTFEGTTDGKISAINGSAIYTTNTVTAVESAVSASILTTSAGWDVIEYSAGANISIQNHIVSGKDWTSEIQAASSYAYDQSTGTIPDVTNLPYVQNTALQVDGGNNLTAISSYSVGHPQVPVSGESGVYFTKRDGTVYIGYSGAGGGGQGVDYTGIAPIVVNNVEHKISAQSAMLGVQSPLYFVEDSESATVIGFSGSSNFPESADQACQVVTANSADWNACKTIVYNNSANWGDIPTKVVANSGLATGSDILYIVTGS